MVFGTFSAIGSFINIIISMFSSDSHTVHYTSDDMMTSAEFLGFGGFLINCLELLRNCLIIYQGWIGYKATKEDNHLVVEELIRKTLWLLGGHLIIITIQAIIGAFAIITYSSQDCIFGCITTDNE